MTQGTTNSMPEVSINTDTLMYPRLCLDALIPSKSDSMANNHQQQSMRMLRSTEDDRMASGLLVRKNKDTISPSNSRPTVGATQSRSKKKRNSQKKEGLPRRPLTAYNLFFRDQRVKILEDIEKGVSPPEMNPCSGDGGDDVKVEQCEPNITEVEKTQVGSNSISEGKLEVPSFPSASSAAFMQLRKPGSKRKRANPHGKISFQSLAKIIGSRWKKIERRCVVEYEKLAADDKRRYKREMAEYKARQRARQHDTTALQTVPLRDNDGRDNSVLNGCNGNPGCPDVTPSSRTEEEPTRARVYSTGQTTSTNSLIVNGTMDTMIPKTQMQQSFLNATDDLSTITMMLAQEPPRKFAKIMADPVVSATSSLMTPLPVKSLESYSQELTPQEIYMRLAAAVGILDEDQQLPDQSSVFDIEPIDVFGGGC